MYVHRLSFSNAYDALTLQVESLKKEVTESHKVEEDLRKKLSNKEQTLEKKEVTHQKKVDELNHEITKLKADLVEKRKSKRGVKTRSESLEEACTQLQSEKTEMERQLTTLVESNKMKGERNRELMQENAQLKAELRLAAATGKMEVCSQNVCMTIPHVLYSDDRGVGLLAQVRGWKIQDGAYIQLYM